MWIFKWNEFSFLEREGFSFIFLRVEQTCVRWRMLQTVSPVPWSYGPGWTQSWAMSCPKAMTRVLRSDPAPARKRTLGSVTYSSLCVHYVAQVAFLYLLPSLACMHWLLSPFMPRTRRHFPSGLYFVLVSLCFKQEPWDDWRLELVALVMLLS